MYYFEVFNALYLAKVKYLVVGGLAVNLHGVPRITYDIDIIISTDRNNVLKLNKVLNNLGYIPRLPINPNDIADNKILKDWIENRNLKAFSFYHKKDNYKIIDIVLVHPLNFNDAFKNKIVKNVKNIEIYLASINDVVKMKEFSGRPQDLSDIIILNKIKKFLEDEKC